MFASKCALSRSNQNSSALKQAQTERVAAVGQADSYDLDVSQGHVAVREDPLEQFRDTCCRSSSTACRELGWNLYSELATSWLSNLMTSNMPTQKS